MASNYERLLKARVRKRQEADTNGEVDSARKRRIKNWVDNEIKTNNQPNNITYASLERRNDYDASNSKLRRTAERYRHANVRSNSSTGRRLGNGTRTYSENGGVLRFRKRGK